MKIFMRLFLSQIEWLIEQTMSKFQASIQPPALRKKKAISPNHPLGTFQGLLLKVVIFIFDINNTYIARIIL